MASCDGRPTLHIFDFEGADVRIVTRDGEPWWVAADVARPLGFDRTSNMLRMLDEDEKGAHKVSTPGGAQEMAILSESGLYAAILRSRQPDAKRFKRWVTHEVLPAIRRRVRGLDGHESASVEVGLSLEIDDDGIAGWGARAGVPALAVDAPTSPPDYCQAARLHARLALQLLPCLRRA